MKQPHHLRDASGEIVLREEERTECEVWTRCMGYLRPVSFFNAGKQSEFRDRKCFTESKAHERMEV